MIERNWPEDGYMAHCDHCSADEELPEREFAFAVQELKRRGWRIERDGEEWRHRCPACQVSVVPS